ncbi:MAG: hypothetical protein IPK16_21665 [Anaerolineales bacterium]|nr:hypothetical protein [Anaerolineales bacterium]
MSGRRAGRRRADWKADSLPPVEDPDRISTGKTIADIAFTLAAIVIFNGFGDRIGYFNQVDGRWTIFPIFGPGFMAFVPWLTALWVAEILLKTYLLTQGRWHTITRLVELLLSVVGIMLLAFMLAAGNLAAQANLEPLFRLVIGIVLAVATVDAIVQVYRLVKR